MSVIVGKCPHGVILSAAVEGKTTRAFLESMAAAYALERVEETAVSLGGQCAPCRARYEANMQLLNTPAGTGSAPSAA